MYAVAAVGIGAIGMAMVTLCGYLFMLSMGATAAVSTVMFGPSRRPFSPLPSRDGWPRSSRTPRWSRSST